MWGFVWLLLAGLSARWLYLFWHKFRCTEHDLDQTLAHVKSRYAHAQHLRSFALDLTDTHLCVSGLKEADQITAEADRAMLRTVTPRIFYKLVVVAGLVWTLLCIGGFVYTALAV